MRVLVTGATGFVGVNLVDRLLDRGDQPVALVRAHSPVELLPDAVELREGDVTDPDACARATRDVDAVIHLAAVRESYTGTVQDWHHLDRERMEAVNVGGTENLVAAADAAGVERFVFTSTFYAYPDLPKRHRRTDPYVASKSAAGEVLSEGDHDLEYATLYPTYMVGPKDYRLNRLVHFWRVRANRVLFPPLYLPGGFNVVHVGDVVGSACHALDTADADHHVVAGKNVSSRAFHRRIAEVLGTPCRVVPFPYALSRYVVAPVVDALHERGLAPVEGEWFRRHNDDNVPEEYAGRAPVEGRSLERTIRDTDEWYRDVGLL
jgi:dihydroflavonol-4-reductase